MPQTDTQASDPSAPQWFATTHWSVVLAAGRTDAPEATAALEKLCRAYWMPIYSYVRRRGHPPHDARDLTQSFFALLLERNDFGAANPQRGRFRSYLLSSLNHYLANQYDRARAEKRGGGKTFISLDDESIEERYRAEPVSDLSPDRIYEQRWALALMEQALEALRTEFVEAGKTQQFERLKSFLTSEPAPGDYASAAAALDMTEGAVAVAVYRLRQRYRDLVRREIAQTVSSPLEIEEEMQHLLRLLQGA
jgi:RNA polymerase sigma-70 factor (ECF subfamily)